MGVRSTSLLLLVAAAAAAAAAAGAAQAQVAAFDGVYRGSSASNNCPVYNPVLRVKNGMAEMRLNPQTTFDGAVTADGSVDIVLGRGRFNGRFTGGRFNGNLSYKKCQYTMELAK